MNSVETLPSTTFGGRRFTRKQLVKIQETVQTFPNLSRKELAQTICEHVSWKNARGANKTDSCLKLLETLEAHGVVTLPEKRRADVAPKHIVDNLELAEQGPAVETSLEAISPIAFERVVSPEQRQAFKASLQAHHYLGYRHPVGSQLGYFIVSQRQRLGCLLYSTSAAWHLPARDRWIGWDKKYRSKLLHLVLSQDRFLIFPWVNVPHLASHVLSLSEKQVASDWVQVYGYRPVLLETFVDRTRYSGTCYRAANWQHIGQTQGRGQCNPTHPPSKALNGAKTIKDIFVRPLTKDVGRALTEGVQARGLKQRYRNDVKQHRTRRLDDAFIELWRKVLHLLHDVAADYDKKWRVRDRVIDTLLLMLLIFRLVTCKNKQSYGTTIDELWDSCRELQLPLPQKASIAPSSLCVARKKLDEDVFKHLNRKILETYAEHDDDWARWWGHRVFAVDGSKINLPRPLIRVGYEVPGKRAHYPQGLVSCLYRLQSQLPVDFELVSHGNERRCAESHLRVLKPDDVVVYDRGYFCYVLLHHHCEAAVHAVFRLQECSGSAIRKFWQSPEVDKIVTLMPSPRTLEYIEKAHPELNIIPRQMRLVKYTIGSTTFCLGTTLVEPKYQTIPLHALMDLYHARWGVEELYKVSKRLFLIEDFHAKHERGVKQELYAHFVLITMNRLFAHHADQNLNAEHEPEHEADRTLIAESDTPSVTASTLRRVRTNFKNCIHVIARRLEPLLLLHRKLSDAVEKVYELIIKRHQRVRPGRAYPRKSMQPGSRWRPSETKNRKHSTSPIPAQV